MQLHFSFFSHFNLFLWQRFKIYIPVLGNVEWTKVNTLHVLPWFSTFFLFNWKSTTKWHKKGIQVDIFLESFLLAVLNVISIFFSVHLSSFLFTINKLAILATFLSDQKQPIYIHNKWGKIQPCDAYSKRVRKRVTCFDQQNYMYINETIQAT